MATAEDPSPTGGSSQEVTKQRLEITSSTDLNELVEKEHWLSSEKLVVKPDMLFGKRGKSGLVALNLDFAQVGSFVKECLGKRGVDEWIQRTYNHIYC